MHPERADNAKDAPVPVRLPDLRGMLGEHYKPATSAALGEHELLQYLSHHIDPEVARIAAEGWGGCSYALYETDNGEPPCFALASTWDSDDDAIEFFGGLIGALESRYPKQVGDAVGSSQDQVSWNLDGGKYINVLRLRERQVLCVEAAPGPRLMRILGKLDLGLTMDDPAPEVRAHAKENLPWNRQAAPPAAGARVPSLPLAEGWGRVASRDSNVVLEAVHGTSRLRLVVDRTASRELGLDGYAHAIAGDLQKRGRNVYLQTDVNFPRGEETFYQLVFTQDESEINTGYYLGTFDLVQGFGYLLISGPTEGDEGVMDKTFYDALRELELRPANTPAAKPAPAASPQSKG
jgi:hypothetical protein